MENIKKHLGIIFVLALSLVAVGLWALSPTVSFQFNSGLELMRLVGQVFGILGFTLFATSLILSARFHFLENLFYGLNKVYERHSQIGQIAFMLMLFHPLMLFGLQTTFSFYGALAFFTPSDDWAINWGIFALGLMILLIVLTLYLRPKYHIWKWTHKFMGLAFFFASVHVFLIPSDTAIYMPLRVYMVIVFFLGISSFIYHSLLGKYLIKKYKYVVSGVRVLGDMITEVSLSPAGEKLAFTPGQFAFVSFRDANISKESHPFSLSSPAGEDVISFTMKGLGDYTRELPNLKVGSQALIEGPFGKFSYTDGNAKKQIWIAGGIGITPFLSMLKSVQSEREYFIDMYYCIRNEAEAVHLAQLRESSNDNIRIIPYYSDTDGFINAEVIKTKSEGLDGKDIYLCAPPSMIRALRKQLISIGVDKNRIYSEEFNLRD